MSDNIKSIQSLENYVRFPNELAQFLRQETYSLLIKGFSGTGKTTLALSILSALNTDKNCLYISTRISPDQLFQYYPWIEKFFKQSKKLELTEALETDTNQTMFIDARLDEPAILFERITNELMDVKAPTIIIDTWDAIGFLMDREALMNNAKVLQIWRERARAKLIFVTEVPEDKTFDFLVDGIVELRQKSYNERRIREIFLSKLHGVRINKPSYIFSVNKGLFHSYDHYNPSEFLDSLYFPALPKNKDDKPLLKNKSHFTTGYHELDELLGGGYPKGCTVSLELSPHVNAKIALAFLSKIIVNFIATQNMLLFQPFEKTGSELMVQYQKLFGSQKGLINIIKSSTRSKRNTGITENGKGILGQIQQTMLKIKKKYPKKLILSIMGPETVNLFTKIDSSTHGSELSFIKSNSDLSIFISRRLPDNRHTHVSEISDIRFNLVDIDGTVFLQSETPWSQLYAIVSHSEMGKGIRLDPIV